MKALARFSRLDIFLHRNVGGTAIKQILCTTIAISLAGPIQFARAEVVADCAQSSDWDLQIEACTTVIQSGEQFGADLATAYRHRGNAYLGKGDFDRAIAQYDQALRVDPNHVDAYYNRGSVYFHMGDFDRAIAEVDQVLRLNPGDIDAYYLRGLGYFNIGETDRAIADFDQVLHLDPSHAEAYYDRGRAYHHKKEYDRADADFEQAKRLDPSHVKSARTMDDCVQSWDRDRQISACTDAIGSGKWTGAELAWAYNNRGAAWYQEWQYDRAIADFDQALRLSPSQATAYYGRGLAYYQKGDHDRAIADFDQALRLKPSYAKAYHARGVMFYYSGDSDRAISDFDQALRLDPGYDKTDYYRSRALVCTQRPITCPVTDNQPGWSVLCIASPCEQIRRQ